MEFYLTSSFAVPSTSVKAYDINRMAAASVKYGITPVVKAGFDLHLGQEGNVPAAVINMTGIPNESHFRYLRELELQNVSVINSVSRTKTADDKMLCYLELKYNHIPVPKTLNLNPLGLSNIARMCDEITDRLGFPCIIKLPNSGLGYGVVKVDNASQLSDLLAMLLLSMGRFGSSDWTANLLAQEYVEISAGKAIRVIVLNNKCVGALYKANSVGWKTNTHATGWSRSPYEIGPELERLSLRVCEVLGLAFAGIDFHILENGFSVGEVNSCPNFEAFEKIYPDINLSELLIEYLMNNLINK